MQPGRTARQVIAVLGIALLALGVHAAIVRGIADGDYSSVRFAMERWAKTRTVSPADEWEVAMRQLNAAIGREPANPLYAEELGRLHELRAIGVFGRIDPASREVHLRRALAQFREAARLRPGSPYAWASVALLKYRLDEMDYEFYGALERADRFGAWEPGVQRIVADVGLAGWPWLAYRGREIVAGTIERGLVSQPDEMRRLVNHYQQGAGPTPERGFFCADPVARTRQFRDLCGAR